MKHHTNNMAHTYSQRRNRKRVKHIDFEVDSDSETEASGPGPQSQSQPQSQSHSIEIWPRFLIVHCTAEGKKAARLHPFLVGETLRSCTGRPDASRLRSGDLLVECKRKAHSNSLLQLQKIGDYPVTVSPHRSLNSSRGVIRDEALADLGEAELIRALKSQAVTHAKVFKTGTIILTFGQPTAPEKLWAGFYWVKVKAFIPLPLRCFKCQSDSETEASGPGPQSQSQPQSQSHSIEIWPRFLIVHCTAEGKKAARLHPFLVGETLRSCTGRPDASRLRSGDLLVECKRKAHSNSLLQLQKIGDYPVTVSPHRSLNSSRGVIRDEALADLGEAELIRALKSQAVTHAKVFKTGTIILTFGQPTAPEKLWAGFYWVKVKAFIPLPLRCFKCQRFGHGQASCRNDPTCAKCGGKDHDDKDCSSSPACINCKGSHPSSSKDCPKWKEECTIQRIRVEQKVSFPEARRMASDCQEQEMGVPQGSILSPVLFSLKINNIVKSVTKGTDASLFVDDFALCVKGKSLHRVERHLQLCLQQILADFPGFRRIFTDGSKSEDGRVGAAAVMDGHVGIRGNRRADRAANAARDGPVEDERMPCDHFPVILSTASSEEDATVGRWNLKKANWDLFSASCRLAIDGSPIKVVQEAKFLGLIFDRRLTFRSHIKYLRASCMKALDVLRVVGHTDWGGDRTVLLRLYRALVRSKLDYGCIVYSSASKSTLKLLNTVHHEGLRICLGAFRTSPVHSLYAEAGEPSLALRRTRLMLNYVLKLKANPDNPAYNCVFKPDFEDLHDVHKNEPKPLSLRVRPLLQAAGVDINSVDESVFPATPPWTLPIPEVRLDLTSHKKAETPDPIYFHGLQQILADFPGFRRIFTDGSKSEDGRVGAAAVMDALSDLVRGSRRVS
nr:hypothetical protein BaRGS_015758 [Batillaria attramentaria]